MNIAILTNFQDFNPGYSLTGIVLDQARMLIRKGDTVHLFVSERFNKESIEFVKQFPEFLSEKLHIHTVVPFGHLIDYSTMINWTEDHKTLSARVASVLSKSFLEAKIEVAFTHDWIFTGWNLPYAGGIRYLSLLQPEIGWLHWVHSVPSVMRDWWTLDSYGPSHYIVFPNKTEAKRVAEQFRVDQSRVLPIPHIKDIRSWYEVCPEVWEFVDNHPNFLQADLIQVYPASSDRLSAKGVDRLIGIFSCWKKKTSSSVCLVIANQWATGRNRKEGIDKYYDIAAKSGMVPMEELIFTSDEKKSFEKGISSRMLRELQLFSNVFIFPTREESFGLVGPEAALAGVVPVLNNSLFMMREVFQNSGLYYDFSSFHNQFEPGQGWENYLEAVALQVYSQISTNPAILAKTYCRQRYNMDFLYQRYYLPHMNFVASNAKKFFPEPRFVDEAMAEVKKIRDAEVKDGL